MRSFFLTSHDLAERWSINPNTLSQWRWNGKGPHFMKIGRRILYRLQDIESFESQKLYISTTQIGSKENIL